MICKYCGYQFRDELGRYGCPNCLGEGLKPAMHTKTKTVQSRMTERHYNMLHELAKGEQMTASEWIRSRIELEHRLVSRSKK